MEINLTFYRLPKKEHFEKWFRHSPEGFVFSAKGSRFITHIKRLNVEKKSVDMFFERVSSLREKLAVVLWQFPPDFKKDIVRLERFLNMIVERGVKNTFEFRHPSWISPEVEELLRQHRASFCMADWPEFNRKLPVTSDFVYIRRHGKGGSYSSCYTDEELRKDAETIKEYLKEGLEVFIYFNNDYNAYAPKNALTLKDILSSGNLDKD